MLTLLHLAMTERTFEMCRQEHHLELELKAITTKQQICLFFGSGSSKWQNGKESSKLHLEYLYCTHNFFRSWPRMQLRSIYQEAYEKAWMRRGDIDERHTHAHAQSEINMQVKRTDAGLKKFLEHVHVKWKKLCYLLLFVSTFGFYNSKFSLQSQ